MARLKKCFLVNTSKMPRSDSLNSASEVKLYTDEELDISGTCLDQFGRFESLADGR